MYILWTQNVVIKLEIDKKKKKTEKKS